MAKNKFVFPLLLVVIVFLGAVVAYLVFQGSEPKTLTLPTSARKITECVPSMGIHYASPADMPFGPIYVLNAQESVIGVVYKVQAEDLTDAPMQMGTGRMGNMILMPNLGVEFDHTMLAFYPEGHEGLESANYGVHMFLVSKDEVAKACDE